MYDELVEITDDGKVKDQRDNPTHDVDRLIVSGSLCVVKSNWGFTARHHQAVRAPRLL